MTTSAHTGHDRRTNARTIVRTAGFTALALLAATIIYIALVATSA